MRMTDRAVAGRYARALFEVAVQDAAEDLRAAERDLGGFISVFDTHPTLQQALVNPSVPAARKQAAVPAVLAHSAGVSAAVTRLLGLLAGCDRMHLLPEIFTAFQVRVQDRLRIVRAEVTTAVPLSADQHDAVARRLSEATGKQVSVDARVDPSIIGGVVTKISSTVYDGSVARQLERLREQLESGA